MRDNPVMPRGLLLLLAAAVLLNYIDRGALATAAPVMQPELLLDSAAMGLLLSAFFWVYAPAQLLAGWLVHRFDIRIVLAGGILLWGIATLLTGLAGGFASLLVLRLLLGLGESALFPSWQLILARHTQEHERGRANGLIGACQGLGPLLGSLAGGFAVAEYGWRAMFVVLGALTLAWIWPWLALTRGLGTSMIEERTAPAVSYLSILRSRAFQGAALGQFAVNYAFYFIMSWLPSFLVNAGGFTMKEMGVIAAVIFGIYALSTALAGSACDAWIRRGASVTRARKTLLVASAIGASLTIAGCALVEPRDAVWLLVVAGVFFGLSTPNMFALIGTLAGPRAAGRWAGAQNVAGQLAGVFAPLVTGFIIDRTGSYALAFLVAAGWAAVAMVAWGLVIPRVEPVKWPD
jgi:MFS family permease